MPRVLVTTSRMPFALDEIRKLGRSGHPVVAADTFASAPGSHSRYVEEAIVTPSPRFQTAQFFAVLRDVIETRAIDVVLPAFEEVFYIARGAAQLGTRAHIFAPPYEALKLLHDKSSFATLAGELGLSVPRGVTVSTETDLSAAMRDFGQFFARPVFSRGGTSLFTNTGALAGAMSFEECRPTKAAPWIVQEFLHGHDVCGFSIVHHGCVAAHSTYVHPRMMDHAGGITFESVVDPDTLDAARAIAEVTRYHGQLSLDFMRTADGRLVAIECNPRPTAGVYVMPDEMFVKAVLEPDLTTPQIAPAGAKRKIAIALLRDMFLHIKELPKDFAALVSSAPDVYADVHDLLPALYSLLSYGHVRSYRKDFGLGRRRRTDLASAYFHDVCWDGDAASDAETPRPSALPPSPPLRGG